MGWISNRLDILINKLLKEIIVETEGNVVKKYRFLYEADHTSKLNEIQEYNSDNDLFYNSTLIEWAAFSTLFL